MSTKITLTALEELDVDVDRDMETGQITVTLTTDTDTIVIDAGSAYDDAYQLQRTLTQATSQARSLVDEWEELPGEYDAYVGDDRHGYTVSIEGLIVGTFPRYEMAVIELAEVMAESGTFPAAWHINDRGNMFPIDDEVRRYHNEGGDKMLPIPGAQYERGTGLADASGAFIGYVVKDYGHAGIMTSWGGEPHVVDGDDRDGLTVVEDDDEEDNVRGCSCGMADYGAPGHDGHN